MIANDYLQGLGKTVQVSALLFLAYWFCCLIVPVQCFMLMLFCV